MPEKGTIVVYFGKRDQRYGFIKPDSGGRDIYFSLYDWRSVLAGDAEPTFDPINLTPIALHPNPTNRVVFERGQSKDGRSKAKPWAYAHDWESAERIIARRNTQSQEEKTPVYRVFRRMDSPVGSKSGSPEVLWEGSDIDEALRLFPLPGPGDDPTDDSLLPYYEHDMIFEVWHWWEEQQPDGSWKQCQDPRPLSGLLRNFEEINFGRHER